MEVPIQIQVHESPFGLFVATSDEFPPLAARRGRIVAEAVEHRTQRCGQTYRSWSARVIPEVADACQSWSPKFPPYLYLGKTQQ
jgi:hypothetical protein